MKYLTFLLFASVVSMTHLFAQKVNWEQATNWKLYKVNEHIAFDYSLDSLSKLESISLDRDSMMQFTAKTDAWSKDKNAVWMGVYVVTCDLPDKQTRKMEISVYGGFFYDELEGRYYEVAANKRNEWLEYFQDKSAELLAR